MNYADIYNVDSGCTLLELEEEGIACDRCGEYFEEDLLTIWDDINICEDCLTEYTFICNDCDERYWEEDACCVGDTEICPDCFSNNYRTCSTCHSIVSNDDVCYSDASEPYCSDCFNKIYYSESIKEYSYKPIPIFYGSGLYYGVELEIDDGGKNIQHAADLMDIANEHGQEHIYCKHDSSLDDGFELVSHPMTLEYHKNSVSWEMVLQKALLLGYKSHMTQTCGLHLHVGRKELGSSYSEQEEVIGRILYFVEKFWDNILIFSRRTQAQIGQWASRYGCDKKNPPDTLKHVKEGNYGR